MLLSTLSFIAILLGIYFRSLTVFILGLIGFLFLLFPIQTTIALVIGAGLFYLFNRSKNHEQSKLHSSSDRDVDPS
jgi:hypothetical protein